MFFTYLGQFPCTGTSCLAVLTSAVLCKLAKTLKGWGGGREKITLGLNSTFLGRSFLKGQHHEILLINFFKNS